MRKVAPRWFPVALVVVAGACGGCHDSASSPRGIADAAHQDTPIDLLDEPDDTESTETLRDAEGAPGDAEPASDAAEDLSSSGDAHDLRDSVDDETDDGMDDDMHDDDGDGDGDGDSGLDTSDPADTTDSGDAADPPGRWRPERPAQRVGIFYLAWHTYATVALQGIDASERWMVDTVIRRPDLSFADLLLRRGLFDAAVGFHWHAEPEGGFYCLYRARDDGTPPGAPDCRGIAEVARRHAERLHDAGIDFIFADWTNLPEDNGFADVLGVRPIEVLLEEWDGLRRAGRPTPDVALWVPATEAQGADAPLFRRALTLLGEERWADLLVRDGDGRPVLFIVDQPALPASERFLDEIRDAGVVPVRLWGNLPDATLQAGTAAWMQPCTEGGGFTTLIARDRPCGQFWSRATPIGSVVSVSASYQVGYASMPWQASGRNEGLTLQKQFETAFVHQPDWVLINAWNEHIAQPQANPYSAALGELRRSMGMAGRGTDDPSAPWLWVDAYGHDLSRDLEPTIDGGRDAYDLLVSCVRTYRMGPGACETAAGAAEACCALAGGMQPVRVLRLRESDDYRSCDHVATLATAERDVLVGSGAWEETCGVAWAPPGWCGNGTAPNGPFLVYADGGANRRELFRCLKPDNTHLLSVDAACEGLVGEGALGWVSEDRTSGTPRALRRCFRTTAGRHYHELDGGCEGEGVVDEGVLGYVR